MSTAGLASYSRRRESDVAGTAHRWGSLCAAMSENLESLLSKRKSRAQISHTHSERMFAQAETGILVVYGLKPSLGPYRETEKSLALFPLMREVLISVNGRVLNDSEFLEQFSYFKFLNAQIPIMTEVPEELRPGYKKLNDFYKTIVRKGEGYDPRFNMNDDDE